MKICRRTNKGWSLIEVMIASVLALMIIGSISLFFRQALKSLSSSGSYKYIKPLMENPESVLKGNMFSDIRGANRVLQINYPIFLENYSMRELLRDNQYCCEDNCIISLAAPARRYTGNNAAIDLSKPLTQGGQQIPIPIDIARYMYFPHDVVKRAAKRFNSLMGGTFDRLKGSGHALCLLDSRHLNGWDDYFVENIHLLLNNIKEISVRFDAPIIAGINRTCETRARGDDIQLVPVGARTLTVDTPVIAPGPNGVIDSIPGDLNGDGVLGHFPNQGINSPQEADYRNWHGLLRPGRFDDTACYIKAAPNNPLVIPLHLGHSYGNQQGWVHPAHAHLATMIVPGDDYVLNSWICPPLGYGNFLGVNTDEVPVSLVQIDVKIDIDEDGNIDLDLSEKVPVNINCISKFQ